MTMRLGCLAPPVTYLGIAFAYFRAAWRDPTGLLIGGGNDPIQTMWTLGWPLHALALGQNPWLTDYLDYPGGVNLMWTPTPLAPAVLLGPITTVWGPIVSYNLLMTLGPALSAWAASAAIRRLVPNHGAAFLGGLLYGFSPYVMAHELGHLGMVMAWLPPLVLLLLHELLIRMRWPATLSGALLGLVAGLQLYTSSELLATTALVAILGLAALLVVARLHRTPLQPALSALARGGGVALALGLTLGAPGLLTMELGPQVVHGLIQPPDTFVTDVGSLVVPNHLRLIAPHLHLFGRVFQQPLLPWWLIGQIPVLAQALPSRLMMHFYLFAGVLLAQFVHGAVI